MTKNQLQFLGDQGVMLSLMAMLLVVPLIFFTFTHDVFELNKLTAFRLLTLTALLAYMSKVFIAGGMRWRPSPLWPPVIAVGVSSILSTLWTNNRPTSIYGVYEDFEGLLTIFNYILLWMLVHQQTRALSMVRKFLTMVVLAGVFAAGYAVAQNFGIDFVMWNPTTYTASRLFGSLGNPNFLAAYLLMSLPIAMMLFLAKQQTQSKMLYLMAVVLMGLAIMFTKSRGAFYALMVEVACLGAYILYERVKQREEGLWSRNKKWLIVFALLAGLTLFSPYVRGTIQHTVTRTLATLNPKAVKLTPRLYIWRSALQMMKDKPWLGSGLDTFQITFPKYRLAEYWRLEWNGTPEKAHNFFLQIGATTGFLGLGAWLWLLTVFFIVGWRQQRFLSPFRRHVNVAIMLAQTGFLVQNQFNFTVVAYGSLFWFLLALGPALGREEAEEVVPDGEQHFSLAAVKLQPWLTYLGACGLVLILMMFSLRGWLGDVFFKRGMIFLARGLAGQGVAEMARSVAISPNREIYWVKYGIAYEEAAKSAQQKEPLLQKAADIHKYTQGLNPLNGYDFNNLGRVYKYWGDFVNPEKLAEAEEACRRATELDPFNVYFALDLASVYLSQKRWAEAQSIVDRMIGIFPDFAIPYSYKGYLALMAQDLQGAFTYFNQAAEKDWRGDVNTRSTNWSNLGIVRARRGELEAAVQAFDEALKIKPQYLEARINRALIMEQRGLGREAVQEYRYILQQAPRYPRAEELKKKIERLERGVSP
ncbi:O-antigen ligase family protein [candidate division FCPU426 bacterium]|nr:O-antigen ligase family protein [candidate division FCPU426 bacterium]